MLAVNLFTGKLLHISGTEFYFAKGNGMKKLFAATILSMLLALALQTSAYAAIGDMGFFGGTSQGRKLPKTTEEILAKDKNKNKKDTFIYKEYVVVGGVPREFEGSITIDSKTNKIKDDAVTGTYDVTFTVAPSATVQSDVLVARTIKFNVNYRKEGSQKILDYEADMKSWKESIVTPEGEFVLDASRSNFNISILLDETPGVDYYKGTISMNAVYVGENGDTTVQSTGSIYGYENAWSSTETHRIDTWVYGPDYQMQYQLRPSVSVNKTLQYSENEPTAISFKGNYMEVISNKSSLSYDIFVKPANMFFVEDKGATNIQSYNNFEQLTAPDTAFLKGHFAEADISKLFSMGVLDGNTRHFQPAQAMTRGELVEALAKAVKLPVEEATTSKSKKKTIKIVFPDVLPDREEYRWIMAAHNAGLAIGRDNGNFYIDSPITRQEAIVILVRTLGLENLGLDPTPMTSFVDDKQIADWAKKEIYAAQRLGIIFPDADGKLNPLTNISKAEGAALVNRLINYMRHDLVTDYTEHIVNYVY